MADRKPIRWAVPRGGESYMGLAQYFLTHEENMRQSFSQPSRRARRTLPDGTTIDYVMNDVVDCIMISPPQGKVVSSLTATRMVWNELPPIETKFGTVDVLTMIANMTTPPLSGINDMWTVLNCPISVANAEGVVTFGLESIAWVAYAEEGVRGVSLQRDVDASGEPLYNQTIRTFYYDREKASGGVRVWAYDNATRIYKDFFVLHLFNVSKDGTKFSPYLYYSGGSPATPDRIMVEPIPILSENTYVTNFWSNPVIYNVQLRVWIEFLKIEPYFEDWYPGRTWLGGWNVEWVLWAEVTTEVVSSDPDVPSATSMESHEEMMKNQSWYHRWEHPGGFDVEIEEYHGSSQVLVSSVYPDSTPFERPNDLPLLWSMPAYNGEQSQRVSVSEGRYLVYGDERTVHGEIDHSDGGGYLEIIPPGNGGDGFYLTTGGGSTTLVVVVRKIPGREVYYITYYRSGLPDTHYGVWYSTDPQFRIKENGLIYVTSDSSYDPDIAYYGRYLSSEEVLQNTA